MHSLQDNFFKFFVNKSSSSSSLLSLDPFFFFLNKLGRKANFTLNFEREREREIEVIESHWGIILHYCRKLQRSRVYHRVNWAKQSHGSAPSIGCSLPGLEDPNWRMARQWHQEWRPPDSLQVRQDHLESLSAWELLSRVSLLQGPPRYTRNVPVMSITSVMVNGTSRQTYNPPAVRFPKCLESKVQSRKKVSNFFSYKDIALSLFDPF